jgi:RNA polymerase sigma-70 factor (ECF subfamily)
MTMFPVDSTLPRPAVARLDGRAAEDAALEAEVTALFDELRRPVFRFLLSCRVPSDACEEIVQEVFLALFRHLRAGKPRQNLRGWVFRVAHNLALKRRHGARDSATAVTLGHEAEDVHIDPSPDPEEQLSAARRRQRLLAVVAALPERERACLHLRAEGLRYRDIARVLGISLGSVALSLSRALARLTRADGG